MAAPRFSILTPVYDTPAGVLRDDARVGPRPELRRLGAVPGRRLPRPSPTCGEMLDAGSAGRPAHPGRRPRGERRHRRRLQRRPGDGAGRVRRPARPRRRAAPRRAARWSHEALLATPEADYVYTDEDKIDLAGRHSGPFFKPDWSPERMRTQMYTCHLSVFRRSLVEEVGGFDPEFEGSQDWDLVLKVTERARAVVHVPRVLYHWRMIETSAAGGGEAAKPWAFEAGKRAVQAHCDRIGLRGPGRARRGRRRRLPPASRRWSEQPLVSIVIPTAARCARSATSRSSWSTTACAASSSTRPTRTTRSSCVVDDSDPSRGDRGAAGDRRRAAAAGRLRPALQLLGQDQRRRGSQRGRAPAAAQRRHRGRRPRTGSSAW